MPQCQIYFFKKISNTTVFTLPCEAVLQTAVLNQVYGACKSAMLETWNGFLRVRVFLRLSVKGTSEKTMGGGENMLSLESQTTSST